MIPPLGISLVRRPNGILALVYTTDCFECSGTGTRRRASGYRLTCPNGHGGEVDREPIGGRRTCPVCRETFPIEDWGSSVVREERPCIDCGATGRVCVDTVLEDGDAERLRDALSKEIGDTSAVCQACGVDGTKPLAEEVDRAGKRLLDFALKASLPRTIALLEQEIATWLAKEDERLGGLWSVNDARRRIADGSWRSK